MTAGGVADFIERRGRLLLAIWLVHAFLLHLLVIGYASTDGLSYRVTPVIELVQHGDLGMWKFPADWAYDGYVPVVELAHVPFLLVLGLRGLLVGFPLVVFPLCVALVFRFMRELTGDRRAAVFGAFAYVSMPMINGQPFSGFVDFAVVGLLAYWLYALLRLRSEGGWRSVVRGALATVLLSTSRQHGLYIAALLLPFVLFALFGRREGSRMHVTDRTAMSRACVAVGVGAIPAIALQVYRTIAFGSPVAPSQLKLLGVELAPGVPLDTYLHAAGIGGDDARSLLDGFVTGWLWKVEWPMGAFYHSQWLAAGFLGVFALVTLPVFLRRSTRGERWLLVGLVLVSLLARDFALPRWAYGITLCVVVLVGRTMATLVDGSRGRPLFWLGCALLCAGLLRPEIELAQIRGGHWISPRVNVAASPWFASGPDVIHTLPERHYKVAIVEQTRTGYTVPLYGRMLTNEVVGTVRAHELGERCAGLRAVIARVPDVVFIDELDHTRGCDRSCALGAPPRCKLFRIRP